MTSLLNIGDTAPCNGVNNDGQASQELQAVPNPNSPPAGDPTAALYYPTIGLGDRNPTLCANDATGGDCSLPQNNAPCAGTNGSEQNCPVTIIQRYQTSFNFAQKNFAAIWLRKWWFLVENSVITDPQQGGLTFVTGGGYTRSDIAQGFWSLARKSAFIGSTQPIGSNGLPANPFASNGGPFNPLGLKCDVMNGAYCLSFAQGVSYPFDFFSVNQKLFNIYDGPSYQQRNAYLDITRTNIGPLSDCTSGGGQRTCSGTNWMYGKRIRYTHRQQ